MLTPDELAACGAPASRRALAIVERGGGLNEVVQAEARWSRAPFLPLMLDKVRTDEGARG